MSLADMLSAETPVKGIGGQRCRTGKAIRELAATDKRGADALEDAIYKHEWSDTGLSRWLADRGVTIPAHSLGKHRRRECLCEPSRRDQ